MAVIALVQGPALIVLQQSGAAVCTCTSPRAEGAQGLLGWLAPPGASEHAGSTFRWPPAAVPAAFHPVTPRVAPRWAQPGAWRGSA